MTAWAIELWGDGYERWLTRELSDYEQAVLDAGIEAILKPYGIDICSTEFGKALGKGLYEFRIRQSLYALRSWGKPAGSVEHVPGDDRKVLLRVFLTFKGLKAVILFHGLNKKSDSTEKRQNKEIARARKMLKAYEIERLAEAKKSRRGR